MCAGGASCVCPCYTLSNDQRVPTTCTYMDCTCTLHAPYMYMGVELRTCFLVVGWARCGAGLKCLLSCFVVNGKASVASETSPETLECPGDMNHLMHALCLYEVVTVRRNGDGWT